MWYKRKKKTLENIHRASVNLNLILENVIQIKRRITVDVDVGEKIRENFKCAKKNRFGILVHVLVKMVNGKYY